MIDMKPNVYCSIVLFKTEIKELYSIIHKLSRIDAIDTIHLIDNDAQIGIEELRALPKVQYTYTGENLGYGAGHNFGIQGFLNSKCNYFCVLNTDLSFSDDIFENLMRSYEAYENLGFANPSFGQQNDRLLNAKYIPNAFMLILRALNLGSLLTKLTYVPSRHQADLFAPYLSGAFLFCNKATLLTVGCFDTRYFMYPEDLDLTRRAARSFNNIVFTNIIATHDHRAASKKSLTMFLTHAKNMSKYFSKWGWFSDTTRKEINIKYQKLNHRK